MPVRPRQRLNTFSEHLAPAFPSVALAALRRQPERRVLVGHQSGVRRNPSSPPVESQHKLENVPGVPPVEKQPHGPKQGQQGDQTRSPLASAPLKKVDHKVVRNGQEPSLDQHQTP